MTHRVRQLIVILGDQLDSRSPALQDVAPEQDVVWMAEVPHESTKVWSHKARIALFLSAMRHHAEGLKKKGLNVDYQALEQHPYESFEDAIGSAIKQHQPRQVVMVEAGEHSVRQSLAEACEQRDVPLISHEDTHFLTQEADFETWAKGKKQWTMEYFYRFVRKQTGYLMDGTKPVGGQWNLDKENRRSFGKQGPNSVPESRSFQQDKITRDVVSLVEKRFPDHPGQLKHFDWPVTRRQALRSLRDFVEHRLENFGPYQDAMWQGQPWLYHSRLSTALNLKLLNPREALDAVTEAFQERRAPLNSTEGFVRQVLGWREYVRHLYWQAMPELLEQNVLNARQPLPSFYWNGDTEMRCLQEALSQTLEYGYAHHIQRLMVTGLFALLLGVNPRRLHEWYLAIYVDAVEWVEAPNTIGMSQFADNGTLASKPYAASGRYIQRMSNYCEHCRYDPAKSAGEDACPFTILYWDFLNRHAKRFAQHPRTALQWRNLERLDRSTLKGIQGAADDLRQRFA